VCVCLNATLLFTLHSLDTTRNATDNTNDKPHYMTYGYNLWFFISTFPVATGMTLKHTDAHALKDKKQVT
jgi:hypothetical protein